LQNKLKQHKKEDMQYHGRMKKEVELDSKELELRTAQKKTINMKKEIDNLKFRLQAEGNNNIIADLENQITAKNRIVKDLQSENKKLNSVFKLQNKELDNI